MLKYEKLYIECYYADGKQILGNGDGQAVLNCKNYKRTNAYKRICSKVAMGGKVAKAHVVTAGGQILEKIFNSRTYQEMPLS